MNNGPRDQTRRGARPARRPGARRPRPRRSPGRSGRERCRRSDANQTSPSGVVAMPYGPAPRGAANASTLPTSGSSRAVHAGLAGEPQHAVPVERGGVEVGGGELGRQREDVDCCGRGSTRTIALSPPSVIHGSPSGPTITPCGRDVSPSSVSLTVPVAGSRWPSFPACWPVYQTPPSRGRDVVRVAARRDVVLDDLERRDSASLVLLPAGPRWRSPDRRLVTEPVRHETPTDRPMWRTRQQDAEAR